MAKTDAKIITLWQPWASAIAFGLKQAETRSWFTKYRGTLIIHAAKRVPRSGETRHLRNHVGSFFTLDQFCADYGCVVAIADLRDCRLINAALIAAQSKEELAWGNWRPGQYAWLLREVKALPKPIPWRGQQGLKPAPDELFQQVIKESSHEPNQIVL